MSASPFLVSPWYITPTLDTISLSVNTQPVSVAGSVIVTEPNNNPTTLQIKPFEDNTKAMNYLYNTYLPSTNLTGAGPNATVAVDVPKQTTKFSIGSMWMANTTTVDINDVQAPQKIVVKQDPTYTNAIVLNDQTQNIVFYFILTRRRPRHKGPRRQ